MELYSMVGLKSDTRSAENCFSKNLKPQHQSPMSVGCGFIRLVYLNRDMAHYVKVEFICGLGNTVTWNVIWYAALKMANFAA